MPSSAGSVAGRSRRWWAPRLSSRARHAGGDQPGERERVVDAAARARRRSRSRPACAPERRARRAGGRRARDRLGRRAGRRRRRRLGAAAASAARRPNTKHSRQRVRRQPVGAVQPGARALADRVQAGQRRARRRGRWPRRPSCSGRRARRARSSRRGSMPDLAQRGDDVREARQVDRRACRADRARAAAVAARAWTASATSSRGASSSTKRSPSRVEERRALAAHRLGDQEAVAPGRRRRSAVGWNCMNSRSASVGAGGLGQRAARRPWRRAGSWCAPRARPCRRWRGSWRARAPAARAPSRAGATRPTQRPSLAPERGGGARLEHVDRARRSAAERRQLARDAAPGGGAAGVHDAPRASGRPRGRARARRGGRRRSARRAPRGRARAPGDSAQSTRPRSRAAAPRPARRCPRGGSSGRVVGGERGGDAALGPVAGGLGERRARHERHARALARGHERGVEPGRAGARPRRRRPAAASVTARPRPAVP